MANPGTPEQWMKIAELDTDYAATRYFITMEPETKGSLYTLQKFRRRFADAKECVEMIRQWMKN